MFLKQNEIFDKLTNEKSNQIQNLSNQIDLNNLIYYHKCKISPKM